MDKVITLLWLDDDFGNAAIRTENDDLLLKGYKIIGVRTPDEFDDIVKGDTSFDCLIIDVSLPVGNRLNVGASKKGMRTGLVLLEEIVQQQRFSNIPIVVYTIVKSDDIKYFCKEHNITYIDKGEAEPWTLSSELERILK